METTEERGEGVRSLFSLQEKAAQAFTEIGEYLELQGENPFKVRAYTKAASALRSLEGDLAQMVASGDIMKVSGIGKAIGEKLASLLETGTIPLLEKLRSEIPRGLLDVARLPGLGAKKTAQLHRELGVTGLEDFHEVLAEGRVEELKGFSKASQKKFLAAVEKALVAVPTFVKKRLESWGAQVREKLSHLPGVEQVYLVGSVRRLEPEGHSLPLLVLSTEPAQTRKALLALLADEGTAHQESAEGASFEHPGGCPVQVTVAPVQEGGIALLRHTGPPDFVKQIEGRDFDPALDESSLLKSLGLAHMVPEVRHQQAAWEQGPTLLEVTQLKGNLHAHSTWSDGTVSIKEMALAAKALGHEYYGVTDHSRSLVIANGLTEQRLKEQRAEIETLRGELEIALFSSVECDILEDGRRDYSDEVLDELDYVVVAVHSFFHLDRTAMTERILAGLEHPRVRILAHPTGRLLTKRPGIEADWSRVFEACARRRVAVEINASPWRLDVSEELLEKAVAAGCLISLNTDAHSPEELDYAVHGVHMARRALVPPERVVNTWSLDRLQEWFRPDAG